MKSRGHVNEEESEEEKPLEISEELSEEEVPMEEESEEEGSSDLESDGEDGPGSGNQSPLPNGPGSGNQSPLPNDRDDSPSSNTSEFNRFYHRMKVFSGVLKMDYKDMMFIAYSDPSRRAGGGLPRPGGKP